MGGTRPIKLRHSEQREESRWYCVCPKTCHREARKRRGDPGMLDGYMTTELDCFDKLAMTVALDWVDCNDR